MEELAAPVVERWLPVVGYEGMYSVSDLGRVRSDARRVVHGASGFLTIKERILKLGRSGKYPAVSLLVNNRRKLAYVHRMVLEAFVGPRPLGLESCHCDGDKTNNSVSNLRWDTRSANMADKLRHGTDNRGERSGMSKLNEAQVREIIKSCEPTSALVQRFGVSQTAIDGIRARRSWKHINMENSQCP